MSQVMGRMNIMAITRRHYLALASSFALLLAVYGCGGHDNTGLVAPEGDASSPQERSLPPANPCADAGEAIDPCESRDVSGYDLFSAQPGGGVSHFTLEAEAPAVEEVLEKGLLLAGASPVHLAFRGTASSESVRCDWRGIARSPEQRERDTVLAGAG